MNQSVPLALRRLGYPDDQIKDIVAYCLGHGTLRGCPTITHERLAAKGFTPDVIAAIEKQLPSISELKYAFTQWILGKDFCMKLGFSEDSAMDITISLFSSVDGINQFQYDGQLGFGESKRDAAIKQIKSASANWKRAENSIKAREYWERYFEQNPLDTGK